MLVVKFNNPSKTKAWGSCRFHPEWQKINLENCPSLNIKKPVLDRFKIVFMDHQKDYNVHTNKIWSLLNNIAKEEKYFLCIKQSTRAGKDYHSRSFRKKHLQSNNVEFVGNENHSPKLIEWADCIINFGSSIGMEVLLQNKPLINPYYLHSNKTIFEKFEAAHNAANEKEVLNYLYNIYKSIQHEIPIENKEKIFKEIIYGGEEKHDVFQSYYDKIKSDYLNY